MLPSKRLALWPGWATPPRWRLKPRLRACRRQVRLRGLLPAYKQPFVSAREGAALVISIYVALADECLAGLREDEQVILASTIALDIAVIK